MINKKILITGTAGFVGFHLANSLASQGYSITGLDNINDYYAVELKYDRLAELGIDRETAEQWHKPVQSEKYPNLTHIRMNLEDRERLPELFTQEKYDIVIHLAAQPGVRYSLENPEVYIDSNIVGFLNILECSRHNDIEHLIYASSSSVYGENSKIPFSEDDRVDEPVSLYAATKKSNELMAYTYSHLYRLKATGLRFFTVYGPWGRPDMAPILFAEAIKENRAIKVFNHGDMSRDFTYIDDIISGIELVTGHRSLVTHNIYNIGNGSPVNLMHFIETLEKEMGKTAEKIMMDMQPGDVPRTWADTSKLQALGYESKTTIEEGVKRFVEWYKQYH